MVPPQKGRRRLDRARWLRWKSSKGIPVSSGVVIGRAFVLDDVLERVPYHTVAPADRPSTQELALGSSRRSIWPDAASDLEADRDRAAETKLGAEPAKIFEFHIGLLHDRDAGGSHPARGFDDGAGDGCVRRGSEGFRDLAERFRAMGSEVFRQKANDVLDLERRVLGQAGRAVPQPAGPSSRIPVIHRSPTT